MHLYSCWPGAVFIFNIKHQRCLQVLQAFLAKDPQARDIRSLVGRKGESLELILRKVEEHMYFECNELLCDVFNILVSVDQKDTTFTAWAPRRAFRIESQTSESRCHYKIIFNLFYNFQSFFGHGWTSITLDSTIKFSHQRFQLLTDLVVAAEGSTKNTEKLKYIIYSLIGRQQNLAPINSGVKPPSVKELSSQQPWETIICSTKDVVLIAYIYINQTFIQSKIQ